MLKSLKPYFGIIIGVVILFFVIWGSLLFLQKQTKTSIPEAASLIPSDAFLIINSTEPFLRIEEILKTDFWNELSNIKPVKCLGNSISFIDSVLKDSEQVKNVLKDNTLWISFHNSKQKPDLLYSFRLHHRHATRNIPELLQNKLGFYVLEQYDFLDAKIYSGHFADNQDIVISYYKNSLMLSYDRKLIEKAITQHNSGNNILSDDNFVRLKNMSGTRNNIFFKLDGLCSVFDKLTILDHNPFFDCNNLGSWFTLQVNFFNQIVSLNGFLLSDENTNYLSFDDPKELSLLSLIPSTSVLLTAKTIEQKNNNNDTNDINSETKEPEKYPVIIMGYSSFISDLQSKKLSSLLIFEMKQTMLASNFVNEHSFSESESVNLFSSEDKIELYRITDNRFLFDISGHQFSEEFKYIVCIANSFIAFSDIKTAKAWYNFYINNHTIIHDKGMKQIKEYLPMLSNHFYYFHVPNLLFYMPEYFSSNVQDFFLHNIENIENFERMAIQIAYHNNDIFRMHAITGYNSQPFGFPVERWRVALDTNIARKFFKVINHNDQSNEIIVSDKNNKLYLIDKDGKILWQRLLPEKIISDIYQIDYYENNRYQYLFNTTNYLFLIDRLGRNVANYPIKLPAAASAPMVLFDYDHDKNYRIFIPTVEKSLLNLDKSGRSVAGWQYEKSTHIVNKPVQHVHIEGKDFIFVTDTSGIPEILNRRGQVRLKTPSGLTISKNNPVYYDSNTDNPHFLISGNNGELVEITLDGKILKFTIDRFSENHFFIYYDLDKNGQKEFIFTDKNHLFVFNKTGKKLFTYKFESSIKQMPFVFDFGAKGNFIEVTDSDVDKIYLLNNKGNDRIPLIKGNVPSVIYKKESSEKIILLKGLDNIIKKYEMTF